MKGKNMKTEKVLIFLGVVLLHAAYYLAWIFHAKGVI